MMPASVRILVTVLAYFSALLVVGVVAFFVVIFLAGPHSGLLPHAMEAAVLILGWLCALVLPFWTAWRIWKRTGRAV